MPEEPWFFKDRFYDHRNLTLNGLGTLDNVTLVLTKEASEAESIVNALNAKDDLP